MGYLKVTVAVETKKLVEELGDLRDKLSEIYDALDYDFSGGMEDADGVKPILRVVDLLEEVDDNLAEAIHELEGAGDGGVSKAPRRGRKPGRPKKGAAQVGQG